MSQTYFPPSQKRPKFCKEKIIKKNPNQTQSFLKEQITKAKNITKSIYNSVRAPSFGNNKKKLHRSSLNLVTRGSLLSGLQTSTSITHTDLTGFYLSGKISSVQKSSFTNAEDAAALAFWCYLHHPLILQKPWSKRNHSKFHISPTKIFLGAEL